MSVDVQDNPTPTNLPAVDEPHESWGERLLPCPLCNRPGSWVGKEFVTKVDGTEGVYRDCRACGGTGFVPDVSTGDARRAQANLWGMVLR